MNNEEKFKKFVSKFQFEQNDLLINKEWGKPLESIDKQTAKQQGLINWNYRWITKEELKELKPQFDSYRSIRTIAGLRNSRDSILN